ncbi:MAG: DNA recombination protein RmuC [Chlamydiia bacterium]|nr:DNA recombination protein RmuC [Chlamydiia bacterium]
MNIKEHTLGTCRKKIDSLENDLSEMKERCEKYKETSDRLSIKIDSQAGTRAEIQLMLNDSAQNTIKTFNEQIQNNISKEVLPISEKIRAYGDFLYDATNQIKQYQDSLQGTQSSLSNEMTKLTKAIKGTTQHIGSLGEDMLLRILGFLGLKKDIDFTHQKQYNSKLRPDIVFFLNGTEGKKLIIDAKSIEGIYEEPSHEDIKSIISKFKKHIKDLSDKNYASIDDSLESVIMFIPSDHMLMLDTSSEIIKYASQHNIFVSTPSTLGILLKTLISIQDKINAHNNINLAIQELEKMQGHCKLLGEDIIKILRHSSELNAGILRISNRLSGQILKQASKVSNLGIKHKDINQLNNSIEIIERSCNLEESSANPYMH